MAELDGHPVTSEALAALALANFGHFTSMRVDDGRVRGLSLHEERLVRDCRTVFAEGVDPQRVREFVAHAVRGRTGSFVVRVTVFDPALDPGRPGARVTPHILVTTRPAAPAVLPPLRVKSFTYLRDLPAVKHTGLFGTLRRRRTAQLDGFDDALFANPVGHICEGATWNIGFVSEDGVVWPVADALPGVTMGLLRQAHDHAVEPVALGGLGRMQAAFATNASVGVLPIIAVDDVQMPAEHPVLAALRRAYTAIPGEPLE